MSRSESSSPLWHLLVIDALMVAAILGLQALVGAGKSDAILWFFALSILTLGLGTGYCWFKAVTRAPAASEDALETLRRENAENLRLLQDDLHHLGQALMKRLASRAAESPPPAESPLAADLSEVKSTIFEMQAQLDQLNDALSRSAVAAAVSRPVVDDDAGSGASPSGLSRALTGVVPGAAVSRLITNGTSARKPAGEPEPLAATDITPAHPEGESEPVFGGELGTVEQAPAFAADSAPGGPESGWEESEYVGVDETEPELAVFADSGTDADNESALTRQEEFDDHEDWITAGIPEEEDAPAAAAKPAVAASQPELLSLDEAAPAAVRPRRPAKGETALVAHMMIGIGNKPYLRGIGPGLSIEEGVPMDYVDVGIWQWICPEPDAPVALSVWKNDEYPADGDLVEIEPGEVVEIHPKFEPQH